MSVKLNYIAGDFQNRLTKPLGTDLIFPVLRAWCIVSCLAPAAPPVHGGFGWRRSCGTIEARGPRLSLLSPSVNIQGLDELTTKDQVERTIHRFPLILSNFTLLNIIIIFAGPTLQYSSAPRLCPQLLFVTRTVTVLVTYKQLKFLLHIKE